ncbi:MAG: gliding motility-associated C-terminal domain-containing protein [Flavobacteriales bacterium]|nr:gliding motility-associated C-terminal domain-containing protein [Flavobacteriales bacterium]
MNMKKSIATILVSLAVLGAKAQVAFTIADGSVQACAGALLDSGGEGASGYSNNEDYTLVLCPDGSGGPAISLQWITFNLSTAGTAPLDQLSIYDGNSTSEPLIGTWTGNDSPGIISASFANPTGCLTLVFTSNGTGTGVFAAATTCFQPCEPPTAAATFGSSVPLLACQGEVINFDASASSAATGFNVERYFWDFADGTVDSTSGPIVQHNFPDPAEYVVQVTVIDDNDCASTNLVDLQVLVSTTPLFGGTTGDTTICQGTSVDLLANPVPVEWSALPESNLGGGLFLPDDQGVPFPTSITFTNFNPGQTLTDINDLLSVCVDMEHSFIGDLVISLTCPTGQTVVFHQQGGGGTFLGIPVDDDNQPNAQGTCYNYCWSPTATNGTWVENAGGTLPSGTYESLNPMSGFVGCDLNGTWTFTVTDLWASDNGFICNWTLDFDPSLFPSLTTYTPDLGLTSDSCGWVGTNFTQDPNNPLGGTVFGADPGVFDYTFSVTDNFGCTYDTTITVTVTPSPQAPITITGDNLICEDGVAYLNAPLGFDSYIWTPSGAVGSNVNVGAGTYTVTVAYGNCPLTSDPFTVNVAPNPEPVIVGPNFSCGGVPVVLTTEEPYASYLWSDQSENPSISVGTGTYTVTVTTTDGCTGMSDPFSVVVASSPVAAFGTDPISPQPMNTTVNFLDLSSVSGGIITTWDWTFGNVGGSSAQSPSQLFSYPDDYLITLVVTTADGCVDTVQALYVIYPPDITIPNVISPNGDHQNDYFVIHNIEYWSNELAIFGRWGNKVYDVKNYRNQWKADDLPDGTYYYVLTLNDGTEHTGHITVLR